jgi:hypothetical protein
MKFYFKILFLSAVLIIGCSLFAQNMPENGTNSTFQSQSKPIRLSIRVLAGPNVDALTYTGHWVYIKDGREINVEINDKTNRFKICFGDYIKSCEVRRTSTNETPGFANWFYFDVNEGGTNVYESPQITNEIPVTYKRK